MSEARRTLKCEACSTIVWTYGGVPEACPACGKPGRLVDAPAAEGQPYVMPDGASILKDRG